MKIALLNFFDANYTSVGAISAPNKLEYCMRHNYAYICERVPTVTERPAAWHKLDMIRRHLPYFDWVFWNDADTLIMNPEIKLESFLDWRYRLIVGSDGGGINTGNFFAHHNDTSIINGWLDEWWDQTEFINHPLWEQKALTHLIENSSRGWQTLIKVLPQREINSYAVNYEPGDFLIHFAGYGSQDRDNLVSMMRDWVGGQRPVVQTYNPR